MSTTYENLGGTRLYATEHSTKIDLAVDVIDADNVNDYECQYITIAQDLNAAQLCRLAEELIRIASYVSDDAENTLNTYNVEYNRSKSTQIH